MLCKVTRGSFRFGSLSLSLGILWRARGKIKDHRINVVDRARGRNVFPFAYLSYLMRIVKLHDGFDRYKVKTIGNCHTSRYKFDIRSIELTTTRLSLA